VAWVLTRYSFPGRKILDAAVDLPFALPTAVAGIASPPSMRRTAGSARCSRRTASRSPSPRSAIFIALVFIGLPFVVRTVQPVLQDLDREIEEASATLGASRRQTVFRIVLPTLLPALLTGITLAFARAVGEYGSVIFIAGNMPSSRNRAAAVVAKLEEYDYAGASAIATVMLVISFATLLCINLLQALGRRRFGNA